MRSSVIVFPGSNCDRDISIALEKMQFKNQMIWHIKLNYQNQIDSYTGWFFLWRLSGLGQ